MGATARRRLLAPAQVRMLTLELELAPVLLALLALAPTQGWRQGWADSTCSMRRQRHQAGGKQHSGVRPWPAAPESQALQQKQTADADQMQVQTLESQSERSVVCIRSAKEVGMKRCKDAFAERWVVGWEQEGRWHG